jgi:hypothetical protein
MPGVSAIGALGARIVAGLAAAAAGFAAGFVAAFGAGFPVDFAAGLGFRGVLGAIVSLSCWSCLRRD